MERDFYFEGGFRVLGRQPRQQKFSVLGRKSEKPFSALTATEKMDPNKSFVLGKKPNKETQPFYVLGTPQQKE